MISIEDAKAHLRVTHDLENALISSLIDSAYAFAETYTGRIFKPVEKTLVLDGLPQGREPIELPWTPVSELVSFEYVDKEGATQELDVTRMLLDKRPLYPLIYPEWDTLWPESIQEPESVHVKVSAGAAETPHDVRAALLLLIGNMYFNREAVIVGGATELPFGVSVILGAHAIPRIG